VNSSPRGELATSPGELEHLKAPATRYVAEARADNTRRAYAHDWRAFEQWGAARGLATLPATPDVLARYLTHLDELERRPSSIRRERIAIGRKHGERGLPPDQHATIRTLERGIGRALGAREQGAPALLAHQLAQAVQGFGASLRDVRDRALLLLGFAGAFRASDLAGLNIPDITFTAAGIDVFVRRSKEDQLGRAQVTHVPTGQCEATCPVRALRRCAAASSG
jgi:site-specific recombinase XerD